MQVPGSVGIRRCGFPQKHKSRPLSYRLSPIGLNGLLCLFLWGSRVGGSEKFIDDGITDGRESARLAPQSVLRHVSSRTYMSTLERDLKSLTLRKLTELYEVMEVHPLTLLTRAYTGEDSRKDDELLARVRQEFDAVLKERDAP